MIPEVHTFQRYYQELFPTPYINNKLIPHLPQTIQMNHLYPDRKDPSASIF